MLERLIQSITFGDVLKVASGFALGAFYFLSPLHDTVLHAIYSEGVHLDIGNTERIDPDRIFAPELTISPTTSLGVSPGILTWKIETKGDAKIEGPASASIEIERFAHPRIVKIDPRPVIDLSRSGQTGSLSINFVFTTKFEEYDLGTHNFGVFRESHRRYVGLKNFTGIWAAQFFDAGGIGAFAVIEDQDRTFEGELTPPAGFSDIDVFQVEGARDGERVWFYKSVPEGLVLEDGHYKFDDTEGNAIIEGRLVYCSPCDEYGRKEKAVSKVWIAAPFVK